MSAVEKIGRRSATVRNGARDPKRASTIVRSRRSGGEVTLVAVFAAGLALRASCVVLSDRLLSMLVIDDGLYYLETARRFWSGEGSTFDGLHMTNGYHPLWMAILACLTGWMSASMTVVRLAVVAEIVLASIAFWLMARVLRPYFGRTATALGLGVWWLNPISVISHVDGMESGLVALLFAVLFAVCVRNLKIQNALSAVCFGAAGGLLFLARSDSLFAFLALVIATVVICIRKTPHTRGRLTLVNAAVTVATSIFVVLPWVAWNMIRFGTVVQDSTWAYPTALWSRYLSSVGNPPRSALVGPSVDNGVAFIRSGFAQMLGLPWWILVACALLVSVAKFSSRDGPIVSLAVSVLVAGLILGIFHAAVRWFPRYYYFEWVRIALAIMVVALFNRIIVSRGRSPNTAIDGRQHVTTLAIYTLVVLLAWGTIVSIGRVAAPDYTWQPRMLAAGEWLNLNTDPHTKVVSFNAGYIGYFSGRTVINIDGAINHDIQRQLTQKTLASYICDTDADLLVDFYPTTIDQYSPFLGPPTAGLTLQEVATIDVPGSTQWAGSEMKVMAISCS